MKNLLSVLLVMLALAVAASAQKLKPKPAPKPKPPVTKTAPAPCPGANGLTQAEINTILDEHNRIRAGVGLGKLTWSCSLAGTAQAWAKNGVFQHRSDVEFGENMFVSTNPSTPAAAATENWEKEKANWTNATGVCARGKVCTHYTQIVWRATTQIGCGINRDARGDWKLLMVCNYTPAGNTGGKAY
jgi:pathogenesis-related protein 1